MVETSRRRAIEDAASELFRRQGYAATTVRDIARALDMQGASLYAHVASKEEVLWSIVDRVATRFERAADAAQTDGLDADTALAALVRAHVAVATADVGEASVFIHEWRHLSADRRAAVLARRDAYEARFRSVIADGIATGTFALTDVTMAAPFEDVIHGAIDLPMRLGVNARPNELNTATHGRQGGPAGVRV